MSATKKARCYRKTQLIAWHMIPVTLNDAEKKNEVHRHGTCAVCMQEITGHRYWRCPNSVCGDVDGPGRACVECYSRIDDKKQCPTCRGDLTKNLITDPKLLPSVDEYETIGRHQILKSTLCSLVKTHPDEVFAFAKYNADATYLLIAMAITDWYKFPLPTLQRLYSQLDSAILSRFSCYTSPLTDWSMITNAAKAHALDSAQWIIEWRKQRKCPGGMVHSDSDRYHYYNIDKLEAELLSLCSSEHEFMTLFQLATGRTEFNFECFSDTIDKYLDMDGKGEEWVMHRILATVINDDEEYDEKMRPQIRRLFRKFPYDGMYQWAHDQDWTISKNTDIGIDILKGIEYSIVPIFYACQATGLYSHQKDLTVCKTEIQPNTTRTFTVWAPDGRNKVLYVDLRSSSVIRDWSKVDNVKEVDAKGRDVCVEFRTDGVNICFDSETIVFAEKDTALKITGFESLTAKRVASEKRKFHLIE